MELSTTNIYILCIGYIMKEVYAIQPYLVGSKQAKSLALVIPAQVVREYNINPSTVFTLRRTKKTKGIILQSVNNSSTENMMHAGQSLAASSQHAPEAHSV
jgi:hypothetical protein